MKSSVSSNEMKKKMKNNPKDTAVPGSKKKKV